MSLYKSLKCIFILVTTFLSHNYYWQLPRKYLDTTVTFIKKKVGYFSFLKIWSFPKMNLLFCPKEGRQNKYHYGFIAITFMCPYLSRAEINSSKQNEDH